MAEPISTPRISAPHLDAFRTRTVRITGRVSQLRGDTATIESQGVITVHLGHDAHLTVGNAVEIVGKVNQDLSVKVLKATDMGRDCKFCVLVFKRRRWRGWGGGEIMSRIEWLICVE